MKKLFATLLTVCSNLISECWLACQSKISVRPKLSVKYFIHGVSGNRMFFRNLANWNSFFSFQANQFNIGKLKFGAGICLAAIHAMHVPFFGKHVLGILLHCSKPQMLRVYALRIVAFMQNAKLAGVSVVNNPRSPRGNDELCAFAPLVDCPVSGVTASSSPLPTATKLGLMAWNWSRLVHLVPKAFSECYRESLRKFLVLLNFLLHNFSLFELVPRLRALQCRAVIFLFSIFLTFCSSVNAANFRGIFSTDHNWGQPFTNALVTYSPLSPVFQSNRVVVLVPYTNRTDWLGNFTNDSMVPGVYRVSVSHPKADTVFTNCLSDATGTVFLMDPSYICGATNQTGSGLFSYNRTASDNLFAKRTNAIRILTNGVSVAVGYTNINFTSGVTGYLSGATLNLGVSSAGTSVDTNAFQPASATLTNLSGTGALTNAAAFVASGSGSASNLNVRSLNGGPSLALLVDTNALVVTNGNAGIGTNAPSNRLTISGHVDVSGNITNTGNMSAGNFFAYGTGGYTTRNTVTGNRTFLVFDGGGGSVQQQMAAAAVIKWNSTSGTIDSGTLDTWIYRHGSGTNGIGTTASTPGGSIIASNHIFTGLAHFRTNTVNTPPTAAQLGQGGFIIWSSNGSPWVSRCLDGSTVESKSIF